MQVFSLWYICGCYTFSDIDSTAHRGGGADAASCDWPIAACLLQTYCRSRWRCSQVTALKSQSKCCSGRADCVSIHLVTRQSGLLDGNNDSRYATYESNHCPATRGTCRPKSAASRSLRLWRSDQLRARKRVSAPMSRGEAELRERLAALTRRLDQGDELAAHDRRTLTSALADSVDREQRYSGQIQELRKYVHQHQLELQEARAGQQHAEARANQLERRLEQLEKGRMMLMPPPPAPMPITPSPHSVPMSPDVSTWLSQSARDYIENRAREAYVKHHWGARQPSPDTNPATRASSPMMAAPATHASSPMMGSNSLKRTLASCSGPISMPASVAVRPMPPPVMLNQAPQSEATNATTITMPSTSRASVLSPEESAVLSAGQGFHMILEAENGRKRE